MNKELFIIVYIISYILFSEVVCSGLTFDEYINSNYIYINEKEQIRQEYKDLFGIDVWFPYFKVKEIEEFTCSKLTIDIGKFKTRPFIDNDYKKIMYKFTRRF